MTALYRVFGPLQDTWYRMLVILAVVTMVVGNLFALRQQNIKRFLAFSSIAQVGFILVGISGDFINASSSVIYFILIYIFSNLAAFGVAAVISEYSGRENIDDYKGLYKTNPFLSWIMALSLFSLAGIPPFPGFVAKFLIFSNVMAAGYTTYAVLGPVGSYLGLYFYPRVLQFLFMSPPEASAGQGTPSPAAARAAGPCPIPVDALAVLPGRVIHPAGALARRWRTVASARKGLYGTTGTRSRGRGRYCGGLRQYGHGLRQACWPMRELLAGRTTSAFPR